MFCLVRQDLFYFSRILRIGRDLLVNALRTLCLNTKRSSSLGLLLVSLIQATIYKVIKVEVEKHKYHFAVDLISGFIRNLCPFRLSDSTTGIGKALAERFVENGAFVIVVGRRKEVLADFVQKHGHEKAQAVPFDITQLDSIEAFAVNLMKTHPDIDCIIFNSGIQRSVDFSKPESVDMTEVQNEFTTNYFSPLAMTKAFLPHITQKDSQTSLIYTGSNLALVPLPRCPNYCASKAALHHFLLSLREQLKGTPVKVIEILPPAVQTELHDAKHQPDIKDGHKIGMPLADFTDEVSQCCEPRITIANTSISRHGKDFVIAR